MIMKGKTPATVSRAGRIALFGFAAALLPIVPTLARGARQDEPGKKRVELRLNADAALEGAETTVLELTDDPQETFEVELEGTPRAPSWSRAASTR